MVSSSGDARTGFSIWRASGGACAGLSKVLTPPGRLCNQAAAGAAAGADAGAAASGGGRAARGWRAREGDQAVRPPWRRERAQRDSGARADAPAPSISPRRHDGRRQAGIRRPGGAYGPGRQRAPGPGARAPPSPCAGRSAAEGRVLAACDAASSGGPARVAGRQGVTENGACDTSTMDALRQRASPVGGAEQAESQAAARFRRRRNHSAPGQRAGGASRSMQAPCAGQPRGGQASGCVVAGPARGRSARQQGSRAGPAPRASGR